MWKIDDVVLYRTAGLCKIENITTEVFTGEPQEYYVLRPLSDTKSVLHIPLANAQLCAKMFPLMSCGEIEKLIDELPALTVEWQDNDKRRAEYFKGVLESGDRRMLAALIKTVHERRVLLEQAGKKLRASGESVCTKAEKLLFDELSYVLKIPCADIPQYILQKLT